MTEYTVKIDEVFTHTLTVEAGSPDEAYEKAREMLGQVDYQPRTAPFDYDFEAEGFTGNYSIEEA